MGEIISFARVLDRRRRALIRARAESAKAPGFYAPSSPAQQNAYARYLEEVVCYFETGRPPAPARYGTAS